MIHTTPPKGGEFRASFKEARRYLFQPITPLGRELAERASDEVSAAEIAKTAFGLLNVDLTSFQGLVRELGVVMEKYTNCDEVEVSRLRARVDAARAHAVDITGNLLEMRIQAFHRRLALYALSGGHDIWLAAAPHGPGSVDHYFAPLAGFQLGGQRQLDVLPIVKSVRGEERNGLLPWRLRPYTDALYAAMSIGGVTSAAGSRQ